MSLYVTVEPTEDILQDNKNLTGYLIDTAGNRLESFELQQGREFYNNSYYGLVQVKYDAFQIMYVGYSGDGQTIQRVQPRVIRPQQFELEASVQNNSLTLIPNETTSIIVVLKNYGSENNSFSIMVSDDKSFVASYSPKNVSVGNNDSVEIEIDLLAPSNTTDGTTTSVSVSASLQSASALDFANFLSFEVSVFSKEFQFVNESEVTSRLNISSFLTLPEDETDRLIKSSRMA
ncbi:Hypothetical predicted protein [Paramuricea clavata]|uniref:VWA7 Ig-like domain-containing protein n=1 Tax=Paramuricea clavata TaxID=317549 RepID=A0A7D9DC93_PARCT|nr:Hypothetical predicted protein [Paramuricea clavata]